MTKTHHFDDIDCTVVVTVLETQMTFSVYDIVARVEDEDGNFTKRLYKKEGDCSDNTENMDEAPTTVRGTIKWDACSHVYFGDKEGYMHLCGGRGWFNLMQCISRVWNIAMERLPQEHSKDMFDLELFKKH